MANTRSPYATKPQGGSVMWWEGNTSTTGKVTHDAFFGLPTGTAYSQSVGGVCSPAVADLGRARVVEQAVATSLSILASTKKLFDEIRLMPSIGGDSGSIASALSSVRSVSVTSGVTLEATVDTGAAAAVLSALVSVSSGVPRGILRAYTASIALAASAVRRGERAIGASVALVGATARRALRAYAASADLVGGIVRSASPVYSASTALVASAVRRGERPSASTIVPAATHHARVPRGVGAVTTLEAALEQTNMVTLAPDSTPSNSGWSAVGAGSLHAALVTGDSDYMHSTSAGSVATVTLSNPSTGLTLSAGTLRVRARTE